MWFAAHSFQASHVPGRNEKDGNFGRDLRRYGTLSLGRLTAQSFQAITNLPTNLFKTYVQVRSNIPNISTVGRMERTR